MKNEKEIREHVFVKYGDELCDLLKPLIAGTPINYFAPSRIYKDGARSYLVPDSKWGEHLLRNDYHIAGVGEALAVSSEKSYEIWSHSTMFFINERARELHRDCLRSNYGVGLTLIESTEDYTEMFHISVNPESRYPNEFISKNIDSFWQLVLAFREKMFLHDEIQNAFMNKHYYNNTMQPDSDLVKAKSLNFNLQTLRYYLGGDFEGIYFTKKELSCLLNLANSLTDKEVAKILNVSPRTVETHINNCKEKTSFPNRVELLKALNKNSCFTALHESLNHESKT